MSRGVSHTQQSFPSPIHSHMQTPATWMPNPRAESGECHLLQVYPGSPNRCREGQNPFPQTLGTEVSSKEEWSVCGVGGDGTGFMVLSDTVRLWQEKDQVKTVSGWLTGGGLTGDLLIPATGAIPRLVNSMSDTASELTCGDLEAHLTGGLRLSPRL
jgi:hypothetical protein